MTVECVYHLSQRLILSFFYRDYYGILDLVLSYHVTVCLDCIQSGILATGQHDILHDMAVCALHSHAFVMILDKALSQALFVYGDNQKHYFSIVLISINKIYTCSITKSIVSFLTCSQIA